MSELNLTLKHHKTQDEARRSLEAAVRDAQAHFGGLIQRVEWSPDRNSVQLSGAGFHARIWVDAVEVHAVVDVPLLGRLLGAPVLAQLQGLLERRFPPQLPG